MTSDRKAIAIATFGILLLTTMDSLIKSLSASFSTLEIMYFRSLTGLACAASLFAVARPGWPSRAQFWHHALRAAIMLSTGLLFFYALSKMPLAELFVYTFTAPIFVALFGAVLLKEKLTAPVGVGLALGFAGIIVIIATDPNARFGGGGGGALAAAVLSPLLYALAMVLLRRQAGGEPAIRIVLMQSLLIACVMVPAAGFTTPMPAAGDVWKVLSLGFLGTAGSLLLALAFKRAEAAKVAVSEYTGLIWAAIIGYVFFGETPRAMVWVGGCLVIAGCVVVARGGRIKTVA